VRSLYLASVTLHLLAAIVWLGGLFFFALAGAPALRRVEPPALRAQLFRDLGRRFRIVGWAAIAVLVVTGIGNLALRGFLRWEILGDPAFWRGAYGRPLAWKLASVAAILVVSALHDFVLGPRASRAEPGSPEAIRLRGQAAWLGRLNAVIALVLVAAAVRLARPG
jgi:putative copper resistance protein D